MLSRTARSRKNNRVGNLRGNNRLKGRSSVLELLEARQMLAADLKITGLLAANYDGISAIYAGDTLKLTASGVNDPHTATVSVNFYLDNGDGVFNTSSDSSIGAGTSVTSDVWTKTLTAGSASDHLLYFAQVTDSAGNTSSPIAVPVKVLASGPVLEPIDNDDIAAGREYVLSPKADLPLNAAPAAITYALEYDDAGIFTTTLPTGVEFHSETGTMLWTPASTGQYHFRMTATSGGSVSAPKDFYLTVQTLADVLETHQTSSGVPSYVGGSDPITSGPYFIVNSDHGPEAFDPTSGDYLDPYGDPGGTVIRTNCNCNGPGSGVNDTTADAGSTPSQLAIGPPTPHFQYNAGSNPHPIVEADIPIRRLPAPEAGAKFLSAQVTLTDHNGGDLPPGEGVSQTVYYTLDGVHSCQYFHLAIPLDATPLTTDQYQFKIHLAFLEEDKTTVVSEGGMPAEADIASPDAGEEGFGIVNRTTSAVGNRWALADYDELVIHDASGEAKPGVMLAEGTSNSHWFEYEDGVYKSYGSIAELTMTRIESGNFRLYSPDGSYEEFDGSTDGTRGKLLFKVDNLGNPTTYEYYASTATAAGTLPNALWKITDPTGRFQEFKYNSDGMVSEIDDPSGRATKMTYASGLLMSITKPNATTGDTDLTSSDHGPTQTFTYDWDGTTGSGTKLLKTQTNDLGEKTTYEYDDWNRLSRTIYADGSSEILQSTATANVAQRVVVKVEGGEPVYLGSADYPAPLIPWNVDGSDLSLGEAGTPTYYGPLGRMVDPAGNVTHFTTDPQGKITSVTQPVVSSDSVAVAAPWAAGSTSFRVSNYETGLTQVVIGPAPDTGPITDTYIYDTKFNLIEIDHTGGRVEKWNYTGLNTGEPTTMNLLHSYTVSDGDSADDRITTFAYTTGTTGAGLLASVTDPENNVTSYTYTTLGTTGIPAGLMATMTDPNLNRTTYAYYTHDESAAALSGSDAETGMLKSITVQTPASFATGDQRTAVTQFSYDIYSNLTKTIDPAGRETDYVYDKLGRPTSTTQIGTSTSLTSHIAYNELGLATETIDPLGNHTHYQYDSRDQLSAVIQPLPSGSGELIGPETVFYNTPNLQVDETIDPLGRQTQYQYNGRNQLAALKQPNPTNGELDSGSPLTTYLYDDAGDLTDVTDPLGNITRYTYDLFGVSEIDSLRQDMGEDINVIVRGILQHNKFRELQKSFVIPDVGGVQLTEYTYDNLGRVQTVKGPVAGDSTRLETDYHYDADGNLDTVTVDPSHTDYTGLDQVTTRTYDYLNRLTSVQQPAITVSGASVQPKTSYTYAADFTSMTMLDPDLNKTVWTYDDFGRVHSEDSQGNTSGTTPSYTDYGLRTYGYDLDGNVTSLTDRDGQVTHYTYDAENRRLTEQWMSGGSPIHTETYAYDAAGQLTSAADPAATYSYVYDHLGRQTSASTSGGLPATALASQFDKAGNRFQLDATIGTVADFENTYSYDQLNRMIEVTQTHQTVGSYNSVAYKQVNFGYNVSDQLTLINRFDHSVTGSDAFSPSSTVNESSGPLARSTYGYDAVGNLASIAQDRISTANDNTLTWTYYTDNKVHTFASPIDGTATISYTYDQNNQLTESSAGAGESDQTYAYNDANGNRTSTNSVSSTIGAGNRLTDDGTFTYEYDNEGNLTRRSETSTGSYRNFTYDYRNRLTEVEDFPPSLGSPTQKIDYGYDAFNRRVSREVTTYTTTEGSNDGGEGGDSTTTSSTYTEKFIYDGDHVVLDFLSTDSSATVPHSRYLYGPAIDQVLAQETTSGAGNVYWLLADNEGSIRDVVDKVGAAVSGGHFQYDAFGNVLSGDTTLGRNFFTGRELDILTGLQYNRERWYDPATGRFISQDPIGLAGGQFNFYVYAGNNPTNETDPNGLMGGGPAGGRGTVSQDARDQAFLSYYVALLNNMIAIGNASLTCDGPGRAPDSFVEVRSAMDYFLQHYGFFGFTGISLSSYFSSINIPILPGITISREAFFSDDYTALTDLIHEPLHDLEMQGVGHDGINYIVGPYPFSDASYFDQFYRFLQATRCSDGRTLWAHAHDGLTRPTNTP